MQGGMAVIEKDLGGMRVRINVLGGMAVICRLKNRLKSLLVTYIIQELKHSDIQKAEEEVSL
jgi:hypothetical protein